MGHSSWRITEILARLGKRGDEALMIDEREDIIIVDHLSKQQCPECKRYAEIEIGQDPGGDERWELYCHECDKLFVEEFF